MWGTGKDTTSQGHHGLLGRRNVSTENIRRGEEVRTDRTPSECGVTYTVYEETHGRLDPVPTDMKDFTTEPYVQDHRQP